MILYIGERRDEAFVQEIAKQVTDEIRMITDVHTIKGLQETSQAIPHTHIIINILSFQEDPDSFIKQLKYLQTQSGGQLTVIASGLMNNDPMLQSLYFAGIKNVVVSSWFPTIASQCIKYLNGTYPETELLQQPASNETTRLDLNQVYQDSPDLLKQIQELEKEKQRQLEEEKEQEQQLKETPLPAYFVGDGQTVKLSPEQLFGCDSELAEQIRQAEKEQENSTTLYHEQEKPQQEAAMWGRMLKQPQAVPPNQGMVNVQQPSIVQGVDQVQGEDGTEGKKQKDSKKAKIITICLCSILLLSIAVPVFYTIAHKNREKEISKQITKKGAAYGVGQEATEEPTNMPDRVVVGAVMEDEFLQEDALEKDVQPEELMPADTEVEEYSNVDKTPTPIETEKKEEPEKTKVPERTKAPEETKEPERTKAPERTKEPEKTKAPERTKEPEKTKAPEETKAPKKTSAPKKTEAPKKEKEIKITSIVLPDEVYIGKKGTYQIDVTIAPSNATEGITWSSSNPKIASISRSGRLKAKKNGTVTITVRTRSGKKKSCTVTISEE